MTSNPEPVRLVVMLTNPRDLDDVSKWTAIAESFGFTGNSKVDLSGVPAVIEVRYELALLPDPRDPS